MRQGINECQRALNGFCNQYDGYLRRPSCERSDADPVSPPRRRQRSWRATLRPRRQRRPSWRANLGLGRQRRRSWCANLEILRTPTLPQTVVPWQAQSGIPAENCIRQALGLDVPSSNRAELEQSKCECDVEIEPEQSIDCGDRPRYVALA